MQRSTSPAITDAGLEKLGTHRFIKGTTLEKPVTHDGNALYGILTHPLNILLVCLPLGVAAFFTEYGDVYVFWLNFFAMIPLAKILGDATEELAASLKNDMIAGLLNATFGNAVEMVITVKTLRAGLYDVVKATLLGSVLSNTLLVLGMSFLCGGLVSLKENTRGPSATGEYASVPSALADLTANGASNGSRDGSKASALDAREAATKQPDDAVSEGAARPSAVRVPAPREDSTATVDMYQLTEAFDIEEKIQNFSIMGALVNTSMLLISCMSFSLITVFHSVSQTSDAGYMEEILLPVSRIASIIIIMAYIAYTFFQLVTHKEAMATGGEEEDGEDEGHMSATKALYCSSL
jgi:Ca2+/H+ antiporter